MIRPLPAPRFRRTQQQIMAYKGGKMAVSAVPGSGKTFTLAHLAATLVDRLNTEGDIQYQQVLIVTFSNSAVNSIKSRVAKILGQERGLLPFMGYQVRTLHGLAHDLVRERPALADLAEDFQIIDEREALRIKEDEVRKALHDGGQDFFNTYIKPSIVTDGDALRKIWADKLPDLANRVASSVIRQAKDKRELPASLNARLEQAKIRDDADYNLLRFGARVYSGYQHYLQQRGAVDFDDLVRLAIQALTRDGDFLARKQQQFFYILEDEAQDSSSNQELLLRMLSADKPAGHNWVRVGDPNQAINTTFTSASPQHLINFGNEADTKTYTLAEAGRSAPRIIDLANELVRWVAQDHPTSNLHQALAEQNITPTAADDSQGNPPDDRAFIYNGHGQKLTADAERDQVVKSLLRWREENPGQTVAALAPDNDYGFKLAGKLLNAGIDHEELLRSSSGTREAVRKVMLALQYIADPASPTAGERLATLYEKVWWPAHLVLQLRRLEGENEIVLNDDDLLKALKDALRGIRYPEAFLNPEQNATDALTEALQLADDLPILNLLYADLELFRNQLMRWLNATILPIDQLILTIGGDIFQRDSDIALNYNVARLLRGYSNDNPDDRLPHFVQALEEIASNQRKFLGFDESIGYEPQPGRVTVATMHAAKGLEWDRVYLLSLNNYSFPSAQPGDPNLAEPYYFRDGINPEAEAIAQLDTLLATEPTFYDQGVASEAARIAYAAERLRLLYVGITRARREVIMTWNVGISKERPQKQALSLEALWHYMARREDNRTEDNRPNLKA
jgi:DNA helicase II / ATP-dependent DNA helicase PcrA